jgi:two-component system osmolarity sensor histidine kinase EnvZ
MTTLDLGVTLRSAGTRLVDLWDRFGIWLKGFMPTGLYARSLLIIVTPMVILQSVVAFVFMERHWNTVTYRLSAAVTQDIAALIEVYRIYPQDADQQTLRRIAQERLGLVVDFLPGSDLPPTGPKPFFSLLDQALSKEISQQIKRPFWIDTVGRSSLVEIRILLDNSVMRVFARRSAAYASNSHIFLVWMVGTSVILLGVAILFLRNQIRPILALADAAESFGKGREVPDFRPRGAREVRRAAHAFMEMKRRVERALEQRTTMLAGVSHDLRTLLTRFKLELALLEDSPELAGLKKDVDEMARMIEAYLAFARGDSGEPAAPTDMAEFLEELRSDAERHGHKATVVFHGQPVVTVRPAAFKRCLANLVSNAARFAPSIAITGHRDHRYLTVSVDDDGPGIPPRMRDEVFKPFFRLDDARNQDEGGTGLGLAIARDIARSHGGDIMLSDSPLGGLRATVRVPVWLAPYGPPSRGTSCSNIAIKGPKRSRSTIHTRSRRTSA